MRGTEALMSRRITGSCEPTSQRTYSIAIALSMIVVMTSCAPVRAFKHAGDRAVERTADDPGEQDDE